MNGLATTAKAPPPPPKAALAPPPPPPPNPGSVVGFSSTELVVGRKDVYGQQKLPVTAAEGQALVPFAPSKAAVMASAPMANYGPQIVYREKTTTDR